MQENKNYHGFLLKEVKEVPDINSRTYLFIHEITQAELFYIENEDLNKTFAISFKTPPTDESGLSHILEHSVLSGSKKYPVKSPFLELRKSSLSTFLNAMTFPDKTMYPVSSKNDKDFHNLMDTYLDAVSNPLVLEKKEIFLQEGWRYEIDEATGDLNYNGIVFNEMKGAYSSPDRQLVNGIKQSLYPDNAYSFDSGGNPEKITELDYDEFKAYHQKYYHPSNSYLFLYGKMNIEEKLAYINEQYLSHYQKKEMDTQIPVQSAFEKENYLEKSYGIGSGQSDQNKTYLTKNYVTGLITDVEESVSMTVLEKVLFDGTGSELKQRLLEADIAEEIDGFFYTVGLQPFFTFLARNSEKDKFPVFESIIHKYLEELVKDGIPKDLLKGAVNSIEFKLRESTLSANRGISYAQSVMNSWLYGGHPGDFLAFDEIIEKLRNKMEQGYFEELIKKVFLNNTHASTVFLLPEKGLEEKASEKILHKLRQFQTQLTEEEIETIREQNSKLSEYQNTPDSPESLLTLPALDIEDIERKQEEIPQEVQEKEGLIFLLHPIFSNKISYTDLYFDTDVIPQDQLVYVYLLSDLLKRLSTKQYSYLELANQVNIHTGGIEFSVMCINRYRSKDIRPMFRVSGRCVSENTEKTMELILEILQNSKFTDKKRIKEEITEMKALKESELVEDSMGVAQMRLASYFSESGKYQEAGNLEYYYFLKDIFDHFEERFDDLAKGLSETAQKIFRRNQLTVSLLHDPEEIGSIQERIMPYIEKLSTKELAVQPYQFILENRQEAIAIPAKVQYVIQGGNFNQSGTEYSGSIRVVTKLLNTDYLWQQLRVLGGAYGGFVSISLFGNIIFSSYRDPKLLETLTVYENAAEYLKQLSLNTPELTKYIIGTMGDFDAPLHVASKGRIASMHYFQQITLADLQKIREEIIDTTLDAIRNYSEMVQNIISEKQYCVIGNEEKINENKKIFKNIIKI